MPSLSCDVSDRDVCVLNRQEHNYGVATLAYCNVQQQVAPETLGDTTLVYNMQHFTQSGSSGQVMRHSLCITDWTSIRTLKHLTSQRSNITHMSTMNLEAACMPELVVAVSMRHLRLIIFLALVASSTLSCHCLNSAALLL